MSGYRCARSVANGTFSGLRGLCEPERCRGRKNEGGPSSLTCFAERVDGQLICRDNVRSVARPPELCDALRTALPLLCIVHGDCSGFDCEITLYGVPILVRRAWQPIVNEWQFADGAETDASYSLVRSWSYVQVPCKRRSGLM
jgi:hypothetical protein